jgi:O-antigen ligase
MGNQHALKVTIWQIIKLPLLFIGLLFTFARAPLIAFVLLFAIMCIKKRALGIYVLSVAIIAFSIIFHHFATSYRLRELTPENFGISALSHRILLWIAGYQIFLDYPIIGVGWQNFPFYSREYADIVLRKAGPLQTFTTYSLYGVIFQDTSHSIYNDILSGTGIVGIIAAIILFSYLFRLLRNSYRSGTDKYLSSLSYGIFFGITSVFMSFLAYSPGGDPASGIMWIFIGISIACGNIMKRQHVVSKYTAATIINGNEEK